MTRAKRIEEIKKLIALNTKQLCSGATMGEGLLVFHRIVANHLDLIEADIKRRR